MRTEFQIMVESLSRRTRADGGAGYDSHLSSSKISLGNGGEDCYLPNI